MASIPVRTARFMLLTLVLALAGCASSAQLADHWSDPAWRSAPMRSVYVIAVRKDGTRRRIWEDGFVTQLKLRGVQAMASYAEFPDAVPDTQQVIDAVRAGGYDGVVVSLRLPTVQEKREVPPIKSQEAELRRNPYTGFYYNVYRDVYTPGYTEIDEVRRFQTDIWATSNGGRLVWSGSLKSYDPVTNELVNSVIAKQILPETSKDGIFPAAPKP